MAVGVGSLLPLTTYSEPTTELSVAPTEAATPAVTAAPVVVEDSPGRDVKLTFAQIAPPPGSMVLRGSNPNGSIEFGMRSDEVVSKALLNLTYTPSPSLLPVTSQLKVYLNDELMGVLPVTKEQLGQKVTAQVAVDPLYITDFNRVRLEFIGHYRDVCENPANNTVWLDVARNSTLDLTYQSLKVRNDLSHFPVPFFDSRDNRPLNLPMVFASSPSLQKQQAAGIIASWFGAKAAGAARHSRCSTIHCPTVMLSSLPPTIIARTSCAIIRR